MKNRITGRSAFLALLKDEGITHLFGNPGTTELPVMDALKDAGVRNIDMPLLPDRGRQFFNRHPDRAEQAPFPRWYYEEITNL